MLIAAKSKIEINSLKALLSNEFEMKCNTFNIKLSHTSYWIIYGLTTGIHKKVFSILLT